jgi:mannobiose 2-epimerase
MSTDMPSARIVAAVILNLALAATAHAAADAGLRKEIEQALRQGSLEVWFPRILDKEHGGYLCDFDHQWRPGGQQNKTIVYQSRALWMASKAMIRYAEDPRYKEAAEHGSKFLRETMWDAQHGGWYFHLDRGGRQTPAWQATKHAYGIAFGIYACAAHHQATKEPASLDLARAGFAWLERHGHDAKHGGYYEFFARDGSRIDGARSNPLGPSRDRDCIGTKLGFKSMNTHIHLLEAFTALYEVSHDAAVKQRIAELLAMLRDKVTAPPGAMHLFFNPDWTPVPDHDSFGHDVETAFLLIEAAEAIGMKDDPRTMAVAKSLLDHALDYGWDKEKGGLFETGGAFGPIYDRRKIWWSQAEMLNTLLLMSRRYPGDPRNYRALFERQWQYIKQNQIDPTHLEWFEIGLDSGGSPQRPKATEWKCGYHNGRSMMNAVDWLKGD